MYVQRLLAEGQTKNTKQLVDIDSPIVPVVTEKEQNANDRSGLIMCHLGFTWPLLLSINVPYDGMIWVG